MFFTIKASKRLASDTQLKNEIYTNAAFIINNYPFRASEMRLDLYLKQRYKIGLKKTCFYLLLKATINKTKTGDFILLFKDPKDDALARLITYGNELVPGCKILLLALNQ
jgi:hypothetical protein